MLQGPFDRRLVSDKLPKLHLHILRHRLELCSSFETALREAAEFLIAPVDAYGEDGDGEEHYAAEDCADDYRGYAVAFGVGRPVVGRAVQVVFGVVVDCFGDVGGRTVAPESGVVHEHEDHGAVFVAAVACEGLHLGFWAGSRGGGIERRLESAILRRRG